MPSTYYVAWWNVENLFDEEDSPRRSDKLKGVLGKSIVGWTPVLRDTRTPQRWSRSRSTGLFGSQHRTPDRDGPLLAVA